MNKKTPSSQPKKEAAFAFDPTRFSRLLLGLHESETLAEFWKRLLALVDAVLPSHSVSLYFNYFEMQEGFWALHHQKTPGAPQPWEKRRAVSPTPEYLRSHVGKKVFGTEELLPAKSLTHTDYFQKVMQVEGWNSLLCVVLWEKENPHAMLVVRKSAEQGSFSQAETDFLSSLHGHFEAILQRLAQRHSEKVVQHCLTQSLQNIGFGALILDEHFQPVFRNNEAMEACLLWNYGTIEAKKYDASKAFTLPHDIREACAALRKSHDKNPILLNKIEIPSWRASVSLLPAPAQGVGRECFFVQFIQQAKPDGGSSNSDNTLLLQKLTPREREVAFAAAEGLSNAQIAAKLGKTEFTVKAQLMSIFEKFGIKQRSQLIVLLHRA